MNKSGYFSAKNVALLGILIALVVVLQIFASAIPMFGVTLNFSLIPIAIAGIMLGAIGGTIVGFTCGLVVFISTAVLGTEPSTAFFFQANPAVLTIMCIGKTTVAGLVSGLLFKAISGNSVKRKYIATFVSSLVIPVINTGIYLAGIVIMKNDAAEFMSLTSSGAGVVFGVVFGLIWLNFVLEITVTAIFAPIIYRVIKIFKFSRDY